MTTEKALSVLKEYNEWRRGYNTPIPSTKLVGVAIDKAIEVMGKTIKK